tara:strand:- start:1391 stop:1516 length:126 start_codon:yes stop_codon:yes gene_type:complete
MKGMKYISKNITSTIIPAIALPSEAVVLVDSINQMITKFII